MLGESGLQEYTYKNIAEKKAVNFDVTNGWLGITDKYSAAVAPDTTARLKARFSTGMLGTYRTYQTDYLLDAQTIAPGATASANAHLFAGAKEVTVVNDSRQQLKLNRFDLLIDWGWFYFITKPLFIAIDYSYPGRQLRFRHPRRHPAPEGHLLPARQSLLYVRWRR